jgi:hypothetical protein
MLHGISCQLLCIRRVTTPAPAHPAVIAQSIIPQSSNHELHSMSLMWQQEGRGASRDKVSQTTATSHTRLLAQMRLDLPFHRP